MPLETREVIFGKTEVTYNRDSAPVAATDAIMVEGPVSVALVDPKMIERNPVGPTTGGAKAAYGAAYLRSISFKVKMKGSGAATTPPESAVILKAAGFLETIGASDVSYAISSLAANQKSATFYYYEDGLLHKLTGAFVDKLEVNAEQAGVLDVTIVGHTAETGTAQAGAASSITLAADHTAVDSIYVNQKIRIVAGPGLGEEKKITAYVGSTKVATVDSAWTTQPTSASVYAIDNGPVDATLPTPTYDSTVEPPFIGAPFKAGTYGAVINSLAISTGLKLAKPTSVSSPDGYGTLRLTGRAVTGTFEPELEAVATKDWMAEWKAGTEATIDTGVVGSTAGNRWQIQLLRASQKTGPAQGSREGIRTRKLEFQADGRTADGELVITFS